MRRVRALAVVLGATLALSTAGSLPAQALGGGEAVADGAYPFIAKIDFGAGGRSCTGALVDPHWVVTAADCLADAGQTPVAGDPAQPTTVTVGRADLTGTAGQVRTAVAVVPHGVRNVALVRLDQPVTTLLPAKIGAAPTAGEQLRALGYGRTATEWVPDRLHSGVFTVSSVGTGTLDIDGSATGATLCRGDAGGPSVRVNGSTAEIVALHDRSWQGGCLGETETRRTAVESRLDDLGTWITSSIAAAPDWLAGRALPLTNGYSGQCILVTGTANHTPATSVTCNAAAPDQQWTMVRNAEGWYQLKNAKNGKCLWGEQPVKGDVKQYTCDAGHLQQWQITTGSLRSQLKNRGSNLCLASPAVTGGFDLKMDTCGTWQDHYWIQRGIGGGAYGPVLNAATGMCLYDKRFGVDPGLQLASCVQPWTQSGLTLRAEHGCLTAGTATTRDHPAGVSACTGAASQDWVPLPDGTLRNAASAKCLAPTTLTVETRARKVGLVACSGQKWQLPAA